MHLLPEVYSGSCIRVTLDSIRVEEEILVLLRGWFRGRSPESVEQQKTEGIIIMALEGNPEKSGWRIGMAHDIFISYSTKDKTIADAVCAKLEEGGIRAWIAPRDVPAGTNFAESIIDAIDSCQVFVLIWSADTNTSQHILNEVNQAFNQGIVIIPFRIQNVEPTSAMRYYIGRTHWLDAIDPPLENHINALRHAILVNMGRETNPPGMANQTAAPARDPIRPPADIPREKKPASLRTAGLKPHQNPRQAGTSRVSYNRYIPFVVGGLALVTLIGWLISGGFKGSPGPGLTADLALETENISETEIFGSSDPLATPDSLFPTETPLGPETVEPSDTAEPTAASTAVPAWVTEARAWAEPILAAVNDLPPDFEDDFSQVDFRWYYSQYEEAYGHVLCSNTDGSKVSTTDGSIKFGLDPSCQQSTLTHPDLQYSDYILQMDVNFNQTSGEFVLHQFLGSKRYDELYFSFEPSSWAFTLYNYGDTIADLNGGIDFDPSRPVTVTIINRRPNFLAYLNSILVVSYNDLDEGSVPGGMFFIMRNDDPKLSDTFELDNIKIWVLDNLK